MNTFARRMLVGSAVLLALVAAAEGPAGDGAGPAGSALGYRSRLLVQLAVSDLDRSIDFYRLVLDFRVLSRDDELGWAKMDPGVPGVTIGLGASVEAAGSGSVSLNFGVADTDAARAALEERGVEFLGPSVTIPGVVRLATFADPDGNRIRLAGPPDR